MDITGFHIEPTNICTLKCAGCARTRFINHWPQHWKNHSIDIGELMRFIDVNIQGIPFELCGNYGDPIYHPDFIDLVRALRQRGARISITTNGSYRTSDWWQELCDNLGPQDLVRFSIDGVPENFTRYRKNADWPSIKLGIETCVANGTRTMWKFIPFAYNVQYIDQARALSQQLGMDDFQLDMSDRFDGETLHLKPPDDFLGGRVQAHQEIQQGQVPAVDARCHTGREHFISANGHYISCCYVGDHRFYYKTEFGKNRDQYRIQNTTLTEILSRPTVIDFYQKIPQDPPGVCQFSCPASRHG